MKDVSRPGSGFSDWLRQLSAFGLVGVAGTVIDIGLFNVLVVAGVESLQAKGLSIVIATFFSWLGSRYLTFREHRGAPLKEVVKFFIASILGSSIALLCLLISHYVLGFTSLLADNISANVVGTILGLVFRFLAYKYWVFKPSAKIVGPAH